MSCVRMVIRGKPIAQPRPRVDVRGRFPHVYEAKASHAIHAWKETIKIVSLDKCWRGQRLEGPLALYVAFTMPRPKSMIWKTRPMPRERHVGTPDLDNLVKPILDATQGIVYADDCQIAELMASKWIAAGDEWPGVVISFMSLDE